MEFGNNNGYNQGNVQPNYQPVQQPNLQKNTQGSEQPSYQNQYVERTPNYNQGRKQPVSGWSWGAFMFSWAWGIGNKCYLPLLVFVPILNWIWVFVCGAKGHDWARESGLYQTVEEYNAAMNSWNRAGKVMFFVMLGLIAFYILFFVFIFGMVGLSLSELY